MFKVSFDIFDVSVGRFDRKRSTGPFSMSNPISCLCSVGANRGPQDLVSPISCLCSVGAKRGPQDLVRPISCFSRSAGLTYLRAGPSLWKSPNFSRTAPASRSPCRMFSIYIVFRIGLLRSMLLVSAWSCL